MLRVVHSDSIAKLADALCDALPPQLGPFASTKRTVIVGNRIVGHWLRQHIAQQRGVAVGVEFVGFDQFVASTFATPMGGRRERELASVSRRELALAIASCLASTSIMQDVELQPLLDYMGAIDASATQARRVQLAERLADLFWAYGLTRPHWLRAWMEQTSEGSAVAELTSDPRLAAMARWQAALYRIALQQLQAFVARDAHIAPTPMLPSLRRQIGGATPALPQPLAVFGFSYLSATQLEVLRELGAHNDVTVYMQNPCAEFWDDARGRQANRPTLAVDDPDPIEHRDPMPLTLWGSPVRQTISALIDATGGDFTDAFTDAEFSDEERSRPLQHLLAETKARVLRKQPVAGNSADGSERDIKILACPSRRRELEVIGATIRQLLQNDASLHASDIAVLLAGVDAERYFLGVPFAFERAGGVPFHLVDAPLGKNGGAADALLAILALPGSRFTRSDLLRVMTHPLVMAGFPNAVASDWVAWTERLGIVHGRDAGDHQHTYLADAPIFDWEHGIRRLALGNFATGLRSGRGPLIAGGVEFAPYELNPDETADAASFALLARSLIGDATWLAVQRRTLAAWAEALHAVVSAYLVASTPATTRELEALHGALRSIAELQTDDRELDFVEMRAWVERWLGAGRGDRGELLVSGVMVGPLATMRALPFRHVFVVGLGEAQFPAGHSAATLDLRARAQRGDVSNKERDRYAFFEALQCAQDSVTLSYVGQDETTGEPLGPSTVILELCDALAPYLGGAEGAVVTSAHALQLLTQRVAMFSFRDQGGDALAPLANDVRLRWADSLRNALRAQFRSAGLPIPEESSLAAGVAHVHPTLRTALGLFALGAGHANDAAPRSVSVASNQITERVLNISVFRKFFESPVQAWAMAALEMRDDRDEDDAEVAARINEPFANSDLDRALILRDVIEQSLRQPERSLDELYAAAARIRALEGQAPIGVFGDAGAERDVAVLQAWRNALGPMSVGRHGGVAHHRYAFGRSHVAAAELLPSPTIELMVAGRRERLRLVGNTEIQLPKFGSVVFRSGALRHLDHLRGMIDHLLLTVVAEQTGALQHAGHRHMIVESTGKTTQIDHAAWAPGAATAFLTAMLNELLNHDHAYVLPFDQLRAALRGRPEGGSRGKNQSDNALGYGPVTIDVGLRKGDEVAAMASAIAERRLAPFVALMTGEHRLGPDHE